VSNSTAGTLGTVTRCPACAATVRQGAPWCTLCYADLRPAPEPDPEPDAEPDPEPVPAAAPQLAVDPLTAPLEALSLSGRHAVPPADAPVVGAASQWPCTACGAQNALTESVCAACGTGFLAGLRDEEGPLLVVPGVGDLAALSRAQRLALAAGVALLISVLTALLALLTG
jgi:hypothetical protein